MFVSNMNIDLFMIALKTARRNDTADMEDEILQQLLSLQTSVREPINDAESNEI